jgi:hypothetical protein
LETRHVRNAFKIMPVKTDRKDARGIAELMRLGWFRRSGWCIASRWRPGRPVFLRPVPEGELATFDRIG